MLPAPGEVAHRPLPSWCLPWWGRCNLRGVFSRDSLCASCGHAPTAPGLLAVPGCPLGPSRWVLCRGVDGAVECEPLCPAFSGWRAMCELTAKGMVCLWPSEWQVICREVLWVVGVSKGVCLGLLGWRPAGLLPATPSAPFLPPCSSPFSAGQAWVESGLVRSLGFAEIHIGPPLCLGGKGGAPVSGSPAPHRP